MTTTYKAGTLVFDLHDMLQSIPEAERVELYESLSCDDAVIRHVAEQIISKWTENAFSGSSACIAKAEPWTPLDKAWREVAKASGDVAKREIERLERALDDSEKDRQRLREEASDLHRSKYV